MKQEQVQVGRVYAATVTGRPAPVRIDAQHPGGGWHATNTRTNRRVRIRSAEQLSARPVPGTPAPGSAESKPGPDRTPKPARPPAKKKLSAAERRARVARGKAPATADPPTRRAAGRTRAGASRLSARSRRGPRGRPSGSA